MSATTRLHFVRHEGILMATTLAFAEVTTTAPMLQSQILDAIRQSVTAWINATDAGRDALEETCEDMNIGDLAQWCTDADGAISDPDLASQLREHGITRMVIEVSDAESSVPYDTLLFDPDEVDCID